MKLLTTFAYIQTFMNCSQMFMNLVAIFIVKYLCVCLCLCVLCVLCVCVFMCQCVCVCVYVCMYENVLTVMWQRHDPWWQWWHLWKESLRWVCDHDKWLAHHYLHPNNPLLHNTQHHYIITRVRLFTLHNNMRVHFQHMYHIHNIQSAYKNLRNWLTVIHDITSLLYLLMGS